MPVFLQGRRAFFIIPAPPTSPLQPLISPPRHRFGPCLPAPRLFVPRLPTPYLPRCRRLSLLPFLVYPAAACHSYPHLVYPAAADFGYRSAARHAPLPLGPNSRTIRAPSPILPKAPPRPALLLQFCPERRTARVPSAVLRNVAQPIPVPALPGAQKNGRNRTEVRPPPKSNQSVAAASPRQLFNPSGQCTRLKQTRSV